MTGTHAQCHTEEPMFPCNYANGGGADMESQVDINTCTDACTHSKQGLGTEMR